MNHAMNLYNEMQKHHDHWKSRNVDLKKAGVSLSNEMFGVMLSEMQGILTDYRKERADINNAAKQKKIAKLSKKILDNKYRIRYSMSNTLVKK